VPIGVTTCWEVIFDRAARQSVLNGAQLLAVPANNATFDEPMSVQQLAFARLRAVEHDRYVVVAGTTGISAVVAPNGQVLERTEFFQPGYLDRQVRLKTDLTFATRWGPVINEYFGSTETGIPVWHSAEEALQKPGTVGRVIEGGIVRIFREDGSLCGAGEIGEIYMRQTAVPDFDYHGKAQARAEAGRDGLVSVGDVGYLDEDGYLFLCDRKRDMVISGGVNIYPAEIENALIAMPGVRDCAVFGIPDAEFGERLCACIEPEPAAQLSATAVQAFLRERLANFKVPKDIQFMDALPREATGKIFKRKLRDPYWAP